MISKRDAVAFLRDVAVAGSMVFMAMPALAADDASFTPASVGDERFSALFDAWRGLEGDREQAKSPVIVSIASDIVGKPVGPAFSSNAHGVTDLTALSRGSKANGARVSLPGYLPVSARLSSGFGMRAHPTLEGRRRHSGVDLAAPAGTPIAATSAGVVSAAGWYGNYGLLVAVEHGGGLQTRYAHMSRIAVRPGQTVKAGEVLGFVGSTGRSTGPHVHYETRINGVAVNPLARH